MTRLWSCRIAFGDSPSPVPLTVLLGQKEALQPPLLLGGKPLWLMNDCFRGRGGGSGGYRGRGGTHDPEVDDFWQGYSEEPENAFAKPFLPWARWQVALVAPADDCHPGLSGPRTQQ